MSLYLGATPIANTGYDKANINLSNLTSTGQNIANWSTNITNCITEIPQDIKLELNNGTLTLKAGSKAYVPNGSGTYNAVTISSDMILSRNSSAKYFLFLKNNGATSDTMPFSYCYSGNSQPTITHTYAIWYDTANNKIKWTNNNGSTWVDGYSLPICIVVNDTPGTQNVSSIDQVFNGFGYIGSTIFVLPNVKGLIPNGRNADGTLKSNIFTTTSVMTYSINSDWGTGKEQFFINASNLNLHRGVTSYFISDAKPTVTASANYWYSPLENILRSTSDTGATWSQIYGAEAIKISFSSGKIDSMSFKTVFSALDYNDLNGKADVDLSNCTVLEPCHVVTETYVNGTSWYRVYSDGWVEQGGRATISSYFANITFLKPFLDTNYNIDFAQHLVNEDTYCANVQDFTNSSMQLRFRGGGDFCFWKVCGYGA